MKAYRNLDTGAVWTLDEVKQAAAQFQDDGAMTLEETLATMEEVEMKYWLIEYVGADRFETLIEAASRDEAIREAKSEFKALSDHDQNRRDAVEVWEAPRFIDEDTPDTMIIPDEDAITWTHPIA